MQLAPPPAWLIRVARVQLLAPLAVLPSAAASPLKLMRMRIDAGVGGLARRRVTVVPTAATTGSAFQLASADVIEAPSARGWGALSAAVAACMDGITHFLSTR